MQRAEESGEFDLDANILNLRPDPTHFVGFTKSLDRPDITSELFVRLLEAYRESKTTKESDPLRYVLRYIGVPTAANILQDATVPTACCTNAESNVY